MCKRRQRVDAVQGDVHCKRLAEEKEDHGAENICPLETRAHQSDLVFPEKAEEEEEEKQQSWDVSGDGRFAWTWQPWVAILVT